MRYHATRTESNILPNYYLMQLSKNTFKTRDIIIIVKVTTTATPPWQPPQQPAAADSD